MDNTAQFVLIAKHILRELRALNQAIVVGFLGIQKEISSIRDEQEARDRDKRDEVAVPPTRIVIDSLPTLPNVERTYQNRKRTRERIKFHVEWITLVVLAIYTGFTGYQVHLTKRAIADNENSFKLMQTQVEGIVAAVIQRQFVIVWPSRKAYLTAVLSNRGKTIASNVKGRLKLDVGYIQDGEFVGKYPAPWNFDAPEVFPDPEMPTERGIYLNLSEESFSSKSGVPKAIKVTGDFSYFNGFRMQSRSVCYYVFGDMIFYDKRGEWQSTMGADSVPCDELATKLAGFWRAKQQYEK